jgi:hypothetical protein
LAGKSINIISLVKKSLQKCLYSKKTMYYLGSGVGTRRATLALLAVLTLVFVSFPQIKVDAQAKTIVVPDDYATIQEAIDNANEGDTIFFKVDCITKLQLSTNLCQY